MENKEQIMKEETGEKITSNSEMPDKELDDVAGGLRIGLPPRSHPTPCPYYKSSGKPAACHTCGGAYK